VEHLPSLNTSARSLKCAVSLSPNPVSEGVEKDQAVSESPKRITAGFGGGGVDSAIGTEVLWPIKQTCEMKDFNITTTLKS